VTARTLGDLVLAFHFTFIVFAVLGGLLVLWKPWIALLHIPSVLWSAFVNLFNQVCPLTPLENRFRYLAGQAGYEGGFIQHYFSPLVYPGLMPELWGLISGLGTCLERSGLHARGVLAAKGRLAQPGQFEGLRAAHGIAICSTDRPEPSIRACPYTLYIERGYGRV
jgi:Protein of Unknown function (DUF2784)